MDVIKSRIEDLAKDKAFMKKVREVTAERVQKSLDDNEADEDKDDQEARKSGVFPEAADFEDAGVAFENAGTEATSITIEKTREDKDKTDHYLAIAISYTAVELLLFYVKEPTSRVCLSFLSIEEQNKDWGKNLQIISRAKKSIVPLQSGKSRPSTLREVAKVRMGEHGTASTAITKDFQPPNAFAGMFHTAMARVMVTQSDQER